MQFPGTFTGCCQLNFSFLLGTQENQCCPWQMSPLFAGFYLSRWACSTSCFLQSCSDNVQWTWICSRIFSALCWLSTQVFYTQIVGLPQGQRPLGWASVWFGGAHGVWKCWFNCSRSSPSNPGWGELSCKERAAHWVRDPWESCA